MAAQQPEDGWWEKFKEDLKRWKSTEEEMENIIQEYTEEKRKLEVKVVRLRWLMLV